MLRLLNSLRGFYSKVPSNHKPFQQTLKMSALNEGMAKVTISDDSKGGKKKGGDAGKPTEVRALFVVYAFILNLVTVTPPQLTPPPEYIQTRIDLFTRLKVEYDTKVAGEWQCACAH